MRRLTEAAQDERDAFEASFGMHGNCSCHISSPCGCCTHPGNPLNQEEDDESWIEEKEPRNGTLGLHDTSISAWEENVDEKEMHKTVYGPLVRFLRSRGFNIHRDPRIIKDYRCLSWNHHRGKKGDLEVLVKLCGRSLVLEFFQNLNFENHNGGQYDLGKFKKMSYLMQKQFLLEASTVLTHLKSNHGYKYGKHLEGCSPFDIITALRGINPVKEPLKRFNDMWEASRFKRDETGWPMQSEIGQYYNSDREGVVLSTGMFRWWRDRKGYLKRGTIYTNMNSMWQLVYGSGRGDTTWVSAHELFTLQPTDCRRRQVGDDVRESRLKKLLAKAVDEMKFERAAMLRDILFPHTELLREAA